ncbi:GNAT family N-acetyltransferase [Nocardioides aurantiacus]|uniref:Acetyltransferase (GNAT) family protein n=1 Tax=Nocardioides aurantiacus TaxID=86796 RepID=A0A3N2CZF4_9ACTN|nr:GNAT family N-acetyltransferase [Nocardioides aurantiacus]ROR92917.1 acetyltransferase (GNAT) family protein [Nocardioides aurantiacus]
MGRKTERLTLDHLPLLPGGSGSCVAWELDPVRRRAARGHEAEEKAAWVSTVLREWGSCGRVVLVDGEVVGHVLWAPPAYVPGAAGFATAPVSSDAVVLTELHVDPAHRGGGLGRMLVQGVAKDLVRGRLGSGGRSAVRAVETFGDSRGDGADRGDGHDCLVPTAFWLAVGFSTQRAHALHPRMRMDLRTTLSLREELERGLERLLGPAVTQPQTASRTTGSSHARAKAAMRARISRPRSH